MNHIFLTTLNIFSRIIEHNEHIGTSNLLPDFHLDTMCRLYGTTGWRRLDTNNRDRAARLKGTGTLSVTTIPTKHRQYQLTPKTVLHLAVTVTFPTTGILIRGFGQAVVAGQSAFVVQRLVKHPLGLHT